MQSLDKMSKAELAAYISEHGSTMKVTARTSAKDLLDEAKRVAKEVAKAAKAAKAAEKTDEQPAATTDAPATPEPPADGDVLLLVRERFHEAAKELGKQMDVWTVLAERIFATVNPIVEIEPGVVPIDAPTFGAQTPEQRAKDAEDAQFYIMNPDWRKDGAPEDADTLTQIERAVITSALDMLVEFDSIDSVDADRILRLMESHDLFASTPPFGLRVADGAAEDASDTKPSEDGSNLDPAMKQLMEHEAQQQDESHHVSDLDNGSSAEPEDPLVAKQRLVTAANLIVSVLTDLVMKAFQQSPSSQHRPLWQEAAVELAISKFVPGVVPGCPEWFDQARYPEMVTAVDSALSVVAAEGHDTSLFGRLDMIAEHAREINEPVPYDVAPALDAMDGLGTGLDGLESIEDEPAGPMSGRSIGQLPVPVQAMIRCHQANRLGFTRLFPRPPRSVRLQSGTYRIMMVDVAKGYVSLQHERSEAGVVEFDSLFKNALLEYQRAVGLLQSNRDGLLAEMMEIRRERIAAQRGGYPLSELWQNSKSAQVEEIRALVRKSYNVYLAARTRLDNLLCGTIPECSKYRMTYSLHNDGLLSRDPMERISTAADIESARKYLDDTRPDVYEHEMSIDEMPDMPAPNAIYEPLNQEALDKELLGIIKRNHKKE